MPQEQPSQLGAHAKDGLPCADGRTCVAALQQAGGAAAVKQVQVRSSNSQGGFQNLNNKWGSDWEMPVAPSFPLDINIVGVDGESVRAPRPPCTCP